MRNKIAGIFFCALLIGTTLTTIGMANEKQVSQNMCISKNTEHSWPMFRYDLCRNGYSPSSAPNTKNIIWSYEIPGRDEPDDASPVIDNGKVYIGSHDGTVTCLDAIVGCVLWKQVVGEGVYTASSIVDDKVYLTADPGFVYCLNATTGKIIWDYETHATWMDSSPAVVDGKVYIGAGPNDDHVYCLNASTGNEIWKYKTGKGIASSPVYFDGKIYIGSLDKNVYCLDATTGNKIWKFSMAGLCFFSSPAYSDGKIYIGSHDKNLYCLDATTGNKIWNFITGAIVESPPSIADEKVFFGSNDSYVYCLNVSTGSEIWKYKTGGGIWSSPAIADGKLYLGSFDNNFYCLNATTGKNIWIYKAGDNVTSSPAIADGALYIGGVVNGRTYCFRDIKPDSPSTPVIIGTINGKVGRNYNYTVSSIEPNDEDVYYYISWGDGTIDEWLGPFHSNEEVTISHKWSEKGVYEIRIVTKNTNGLLSGMGTLGTSIEIPESNIIKNVPYVNQGDSWYCGCATLTMTFQYYGINTSLYEVCFNSGFGYSAGYKIKWPCFCISDYYLAYQVAERQLLADIYGLKYSYSDFYDTSISDDMKWQRYWTSVKENISQNIPVTTLVWMNELPYYENQPYSHYILLVGYNESNNTVCIHDSIATVDNTSMTSGAYIYIPIDSLRNAIKYLDYSYLVEIFVDTSDEPLSKKDAFELAHSRNIQKMKGDADAYDKEFPKFGSPIHLLGVHAVKFMKHSYNIRNKIMMTISDKIKRSDSRLLAEHYAAMYIGKHNMSQYLREHTDWYSNASVEADLLDIEANNWALLYYKNMELWSILIFRLPLQISVLKEIRDIFDVIISIEEDIIVGSLSTVAS
jgi:outer membrane protein assembly factor BamB